jgi:hypothetical protein
VIRFKVGNIKPCKASIPVIYCTISGNEG